MPADILAYGEPMIEFNQTKGGDGRGYLQGFGGDTSNFAIAAARQGARSGYLGAVGADAHGQAIRALWDREHVDHSLVKTFPAAPTGHYFVSHGPEGHAFSFARAGSAASRYGVEDVPVSALRTVKILHLSGISLAISNAACDAAYEAMRAVKSGGGRISFDTNLRLKLWSKDRARAIMNDVMRHADIVLPSHEDIVAITGLTDPDALVDHVLELGAGIVALKLGENGALVADREHRYRIPPHPCTPVDATGAGDCFGGAFIARLSAGDGLEAAGRYAAVAAALSTEGYGAVEPIPHAARVKAALGAARITQSLTSQSLARST